VGLSSNSSNPSKIPIPQIQSKGYLTNNSLLPSILNKP
jgi:hypothetical protein